MTPPAAAGLHTVRGIRWMTAALVAFLVILLGTVVAMLLLAPAVFESSSTPSGHVALVGALGTVSLAYTVLGLAASIAFVIGFTDLHSGGGEYGAAHARATSQAAVFLFVAFLLFLSTLLMPSPTWPQLAVPWIDPLPSGEILVAAIALPGFRAIFCGLVLVYTVSELADEVVRVRLLLAMTLGVVGAVVWSSALVYAALAPGSADTRLVEFVVALVVGAGISSLSFLIAIACYLRAGRGLRVGPG